MKNPYQALAAEGRAMVDAARKYQRYFKRGVEGSWDEASWGRIDTQRHIGEIKEINVAVGALIKPVIYRLKKPQILLIGMHG